MWPFKKTPKPFDRAAYTAKRHAEAEAKAVSTPATHLCEVDGVIHEASEVGDLLVSKTTGKVLGYNFGGVRVVSLRTTDEQNNRRGELMGMLDRFLSSATRQIRFDRDKACSGEWRITSMENNPFGTALIFQSGWRWLTIEGTETRCELTTDEYGAIAKRLTP